MWGDKSNRLIRARDQGTDFKTFFLKSRHQTNNFARAGFASACRHTEGSAEKRRISGDPDVKKVSTSHVERQNLTMRMGMRRFTRLTNGFSKKIENLEHAVALHFMFYNFGRIHKTLRVTPAMEAGIADHVWTLEEIAGLVKEEEPKKRGPYKKKNSN